VTRRRGRRRKKLLDDLKDRTGYSHLKEEALDRTVWRNCFGRGFGPVVRQNTEWMKISTQTWQKQPTLALNCTTPLFNIQTTTCFDSGLPSSGSFLDSCELLEMQIEWVVYHIMCGYVACVQEGCGSVCCASQLHFPSVTYLVKTCTDLWNAMFLTVIIKGRRFPYP
jgi:hypothetical protein